MTTPRYHVEAMILRLMAAFPTFKMPAPTQALYIEKLIDLDPDALGDAVEWFVMKGGKFPPIGPLRAQAMKFQSDQLKAKQQRAQEDQRRSYMLQEPNWGARFNSPQYLEAFERGRRRAAGRERGALCACMDCQFKRAEGRLKDDGPCEDRFRKVVEERKKRA